MNRTRRARLSLSLASALCATALAGGATAEPVLAASGGRGPVWEATSLTTDGSKAVARLALRDVVLNAQFGVRIYRGSELVQHGNFGIRAAGEQGVFVSAQPVEGITVSYDSLDENGGGKVSEIEAKVTLNPDGPALKGKFLVLIWGAGRNVPTYRYVVEGGPGVAVLARRSGHGVHHATARDFDGGRLNVIAGQRAGEGAVFARAQVGATRTIRVSRVFVGDFFPDPGTASRLTVSGPDGTTTCLPSCTFSRHSGAGSAGAGSYLFAVDGTGASQAGNEAGDVVLSGVDADLSGM